MWVHNEKEESQDELTLGDQRRIPEDESPEMGFLG